MGGFASHRWLATFAFWVACATPNPTRKPIEPQRFMGVQFGGFGFVGFGITGLGDFAGRLDSQA
jgi:hypothetical protein